METEETKGEERREGKREGKPSEAAATENNQQPEVEAKQEVKQEINEAPQKDESTKYFLIAAAAIILLTAAFFSVKLFARQEATYETVRYNGFIFEYYAGLWNTQWQQDGQVYNLRLHYNPRQVGNVSIAGDGAWNATQETYITFDPAEDEQFSNVALSAAELSLSLVNAFGISPVAACTTNTTYACSTRPIISCETAPKSASVIYLKREGPAKVELRGSCAIIQGRDSEILRAAERVIYGWYGIIRSD